RRRRGGGRRRRGVRGWPGAGPLRRGGSWRSPPCLPGRFVRVSPTFTAPGPPVNLRSRNFLSFPLPLFQNSPLHPPPAPPSAVRPPPPPHPAAAAPAAPPDPPPPPPATGQGRKNSLNRPPAAATLNDARPADRRGLILARGALHDRRSSTVAPGRRRAGHV